MVSVTDDAALRRLCGLDLQWALDAEGNGAINPVVLARALKRFDEKVFTDDAIAVILDTLGGKGFLAPVSIQGFQELVCAVETPAAAEARMRHHSQKLGSVAENVVENTLTSHGAYDVSFPPRHAPAASSEAPTALETRSVVWAADVSVVKDRMKAVDEYVSAFVSQLGNFRSWAAIHFGSSQGGASAPDLQVYRQRLSDSARDFMLDAQRKSLNVLWDAFAEDNGGRIILTVELCRNLISEYLRSLRSRCDEVVRMGVWIGIEISILLYEKRVSHANPRARMRQQATKQIESVQQKVTPSMCRGLDRMLARDTLALGKQLLLDLDLDNDGVVSLQEFEVGFVKAIQGMIGPENMMGNL
eukprot:TRINITY_DN67338_c0_g1_i1.p1 TRINITY_DN67338_c0_g1~~TRINITY_DN67338_c0_g1_i1.p1  ORF type:complete len:359 (+),score=63.98 TRINITY_DN67338_c0_g1_i1:123-1199(+)